MQSSTQASSASGASPKTEKDRKQSSAESLARRNAELNEANGRLQQLVEYRSAFLAHLAHELRTPLTSILGFSEIMLSQEKLTEAQRGFCERIQNSAQQLQGSLNQLADLSRLETGRSQLQREEFSLADLLRELCASLARHAQKQNVGLDFQTAGTLPRINSDRNKLHQVLDNLLNFAIARSPNGARVWAEAGNDGNNYLIKIEDEGEPIDPTAFGDLSLLIRKSGSSELGLAIARHNIELLGATLSTQNREPRGLQISIRLPTTPPDI